MWQELVKPILILDITFNDCAYSELIEKFNDAKSLVLANMVLRRVVIKLIAYGGNRLTAYLEETLMSRTANFDILNWWKTKWDEVSCFTGENADLELSKNKELFQDLAPFVWKSFGTIAALIQEIVSIYPVLSPPNLTPAQSNRVCNALALLQCVASRPDTRMLFLNAHIPLYLYPFLNTTSKSRPFEYLRLTSLGVIGALVKVDDTEVISFLLSTEIIPLCLRTMEMGSELSKTVATFIVQKILLDDMGLDYICTTAERFFAVGRVLGNMVAALAEQPSSRLLKHIIRCYLRLSENPRACDALRSFLPDMLRDATFSTFLVEDQTTRKWLQLLLQNVGGSRIPALQAGGGFDHMMLK